MGLLELYRGHHPNRAVQAPVVVPIDPAGGGVLDVSDAPVGAGMERAWRGRTRSCGSSTLRWG